MVADGSGNGVMQPCQCRQRKVKREHFLISKSVITETAYLLITSFNVSSNIYNWSGLCGVYVCVCVQA